MIVSMRLRALFAALVMTSASVAGAADRQNSTKRTEKVGHSYGGAVMT
jgi:hypothetical protein